MQNTTQQSETRTNKKVLLILILLTILIGALSSCKKYNDGPQLSLRTRTARVAGTWQVVKFTANGTDVLTFSAWYDDAIGCGGSTPVELKKTTTNYTWVFTKGGNTNYSTTATIKTPDDNATYNNCTATYYPDQVIANADAGTWQFISNQAQLSLQLTTGGLQVYDIKELRDKEMKLTGTINGNQYEITLTQ